MRRRAQCLRRRRRPRPLRKTPARSLQQGWWRPKGGSGDPRAIAEIERLHFSQLASSSGPLSRYRNKVQADEVVQILRTRLLVGSKGGPPRILEYAGRGPLGGWLRVAAIRTALDTIRTEGRAERRAAADPLVDDAAPLDAELEHLRRLHADDFRAALEDAVRALTVDERTILRFHSVDQLSIDEIAVIYNVHRATIARRVQRARERFESCTYAALRARLRVSATELDSLVAMMRSGLHVTMGRLLAPKDD